MSSLAALALGPLLLAASPSGTVETPSERRPALMPALVPNLVIDCYVVQSSSMGMGQFVRHLQVNGLRRVVSVSDGIGGAAPRFLGDGRLVALDANRVVYDFASSTSAGRTEIDRRTGAFTYNDGRTVIRGTCHEGS